MSETFKAYLMLAIVVLCFGVVGNMDYQDQMIVKAGMVK